MNHRIHICLGVLLLILPITLTSNAQDAGFRIETDVFVNEIKQPVQQSLTLFHAGVWYDVSRDDEGEITMVDKDNDRIVLIDSDHSMKTIVKISDLTKLMTSAKNQAATTQLSVYIDGAAKVEATADKVVVGDDLLRYESTLQEPADATSSARFAQAYREFADAVKQLNSFRSGGVVPPFARMSFNEAVAKQNKLPKEILITAKQGDQVSLYKTILHANWRLSKSDLQRITEIGEKVATYETVSSTDYQRVRQETELADRQPASNVSR